MLRVILSIVVAAATVFVSYDSFWVVLVPIALSAGIIFGIPAFWLAKRKGWLLWWHAAIAGVLAATPWILFYLSLNPGHTQLAGLYNGIGFVGLGMAASIIVWLTCRWSIIQVFR